MSTTFANSSAPLPSWITLALILQLMSTSPFLPDDVRNYMKKHSIESLFHITLNNLLRTLPEDPYSFIIAELQEKASQEIQIIDIHPTQTVSGDGFPALKFKVNAMYMNKVVGITLGPIGITSEEGSLFDEDRMGAKGMHKGMKYLSELVIPRIKHKKCSEQNQVDSVLENAFTESKETTAYQTYSISYLIPMVKSHILAQPLHQIYQQLAQKNASKQPTLFLNLLQGGKAIASKCKVFKYYLISKNLNDPFLAQTVSLALRKSITAGKGGEAALKFTPDGAFICPLDTIMDNLKLVQDALASSNAKEAFSIGLSFAADTLFSPETKKYQLENPKTPFDNDQMVDYLFKLLVDKPIISYLEDPLAASQRAAWKKLATKIKDNEATKHVKIGSRNSKMLQLTSETTLQKQLNQVVLEETAESHPDSSEESRKVSNAAKIPLHRFQLKLHEFKTVSALISTQKKLTGAKIELVLQDDNYETYDTSLVDICYGLHSSMCLGAAIKFDRISKLNRMREIAQ